MLIINLCKLRQKDLLGLWNCHKSWLKEDKHVMSHITRGRSAVNRNTEMRSEEGKNLRVSMRIYSNKWDYYVSRMDPLNTTASRLPKIKIDTAMPHAYIYPRPKVDLRGQSAHLAWVKQAWLSYARGDGYTEADLKIVNSASCHLIIILSSLKSSKSTILVMMPWLQWALILCAFISCSGTTLVASMVV